MGEDSDKDGSTKEGTKAPAASLSVAFLAPQPAPEPPAEERRQSPREDRGDARGEGRGDAGGDGRGDDRGGQRRAGGSQAGQGESRNERSQRQDRRPAEGGEGATRTGEASGGSDSSAAGESPGGGDASDDGPDEGGSGAPRRRRRRRRGRGGRPQGDDSPEGDEGDSDDGEEPSDRTGASESDADGKQRSATRDAAAGGQRQRQESSGDDGDAGPDGESGGSGNRSRRRRRNRPQGGGQAGSGDGSDDTDGAADDGVQSVKGSTRLEARRQRRKDSRNQSRRPPLLSEAEYLSRRESVARSMAVRHADGVTEIAVLEDDVLVEHFVSSRSVRTMAGNIYLGRVQNVLPSMEAAFVDIGPGRNAVLYAGEVNWDEAGLEGKPRLIEHALSAGQLVLVQASKDPVGAKGARLTSQISIPGRYVVFVPDGSLTGISRKLPDAERKRLRGVLERVVPEGAGVIVRTAAEGASEEDLARDVERLARQWESIQAKAKKANSPTKVYEEPDLLLRVVRDLFNEDFTRLVVQGQKEWGTVRRYVQEMAPDLADRLQRHTGDTDVFEDMRIAEQIRKALDRKVWLPSGGYLVIDRTEAMTVVDVNTGRYTGQGGNLEETVTRNNLEAAEEVVRQLRLRDIGGIIVIDFIDMVLPANRDLVLRRLVECLARDRTRHQVAEVTSLGLVQMTRKRVGAGLLEAFSEPCSCCSGSGVVLTGAGETSEDEAGSGGSGGSENRKGGRRQKGRRDKDARPAAETPDPEVQRRNVAAVAAVAAASGPSEARPEEESSAEAASPTEGGAPDGAPESEPAGEPESAASATAGTASESASGPAGDPEAPGDPDDSNTEPKASDAVAQAVTAQTQID